VQPNAELTVRCPEDKREESNEITTWKLTHGMCLGEGTLVAYIRGVDLDRLGLEEESDAPFVPVQ
jgi:hypothetical protein